MNDDGVYARAYARALYGAATARHEEASVTLDILALELQWNGSPELRSFCRSHLRGSPSDHAQTVADLWGETFTPTIISFLAMLAQHDQLSLIPHVLQQYQKLDDRAKKRSDVRMSFACEPEEEQINRIRQLVTDACGPVMKVSVRVDPALIAGVRFTFNDQRVDASLAGRITRLRYGLSKPMQPEKAAS